VLCLHEELLKIGAKSEIIDSPYEMQELSPPINELSIAHGLWQWPGNVTFKRNHKFGAPYLVFPHGMLDPWFKKRYPLKHLKKQIYWWLKQGKILYKARAVCFTTEEERRLARKTFFPYHCREIVTGLGTTDPPDVSQSDIETFLESHPQLKGKKLLLFLGRFHPKKGVDLLIEQWCKKSVPSNFVLVLGGPLNPGLVFEQNLFKLAANMPSIYWTGMLKGQEKWTALKLADALILPSHQENYGMVIAEACSMGTPVLLTNKVNLWREITDAKAGIAAQDDNEGISYLLDSWIEGLSSQMKEASLRCFTEHLHIRHAVKRLMELANEQK